MAKNVAPRIGHDRLEEAIGSLIQNEAAFVARLAENDKLRLENERRWTKVKRQSD